MRLQGAWVLLQLTVIFLIFAGVGFLCKARSLLFTQIEFLPFQSSPSFDLLCMGWKLHYLCHVGLFKILGRNKSVCGENQVLHGFIEEDL